MLYINPDVSEQQLLDFGFHKFRGYSYPTHFYYHYLYFAIPRGMRYMFLFMGSEKIYSFKENIIRVNCIEWAEAKNGAMMPKHPKCDYKSNDTYVDIIYKMTKAGFIDYKKE